MSRRNRLIWGIVLVAALGALNLIERLSARAPAGSVIEPVATTRPVPPEREIPAGTSRESGEQMVSEMPVYVAPLAEDSGAAVDSSRQWKAHNDPFWPPEPVVAPPKQKAVKVLPPPPPPPPVASPIQQPYSVLGRLQGERGSFVYLRRGNELFLAQASAQLEGGFVVSQINARQVRLVHEPGGEQFLLNIPMPDPQTELIRP